MRNALDSERKVLLDGTHRVCTPEETLARLEPVLPQVGITRVADITWLDEIGIHVFQAIRPDSRSLCVSQGKGLTADLAQISAIMESVELWHAEHMNGGEIIASPRAMSGELGYRVNELTLAARSAVNLDCSLEWTRARSIRTGAETWLPTELLSMDLRLSRSWMPYRFEGSTNGLASGNTRCEALLHGLYEVIERDALSRSDSLTLAATVPVETVTGRGKELISRIREARAGVSVYSLATPTGLAAFAAEIWSDSLPVPSCGYGCHLDRDVAICRAVTEAAQTRATLIAGTRDDLQVTRYSDAKGVIEGRRKRPGVKDRRAGQHVLRYTEIPTVRQPDLNLDLRLIADLVAAMTGREPLFVEHTRPDLGLPVVHVVCPGLRFDRPPE